MTTYTSHTRDSAIPMTTPARMPNTRVPRIAAAATQKSALDTLRRRRISPTSIIPMTTASMMRAERTGLGSDEKRGARKRSARRTVTPDVRDARPVRAPDRSFSEVAERLVETGIPWRTPGADVGR